MILKRLVEIFKTFDKNELKKFERFIRSRYFNTNESIFKLFKALKIHYPAFEDKNLVNEKLFKKVYSGRKYDDKTLRYLLSELEELVEKFLVMSFYEKKKNMIIHALAEELQDRRLFSQSKRQLELLDKDLDSDPLFKRDTLQNKIESLQLRANLRFGTGEQGPMTDEIIQLAEYKILDSLIEITNINQNLEGIKVHFNTTLDDSVVKAFIKGLDCKTMLERIENYEKTAEIHESKHTELSIFKLYLCFLISFYEPEDEDYFSMMKEIVYKNYKSYSKEDLYCFSGLITSCCRLKMTAIDYDKYMKEFFESEKFLYELNLFTHYDEQYMQTMGFVGLFNSAMAFGEVEWAGKFADECLEKITPELRDDVKNYTEAHFNFERDNYETSLELVNKVKYKFIYFKVYTRVLILKNYYELSYFEQAFPLVDSFNHFLNNTKQISVELRTKSLNFLKFTGDLLKVKAGSQLNADLKGLKEEISKCSVINDKNWLLEKIKELEK